jgi:hypothetical protein
MTAGPGGPKNRISYNFSSHFPQKFISVGHGSDRNNHLSPGPTMSLSLAENFVRNAREQHSQQDINASMLKALGELMREVKRLEDELRRTRRDVQMSRRF